MRAAQLEMRGICTMSEPPKTINIFYSYVHEDHVLQEKLEKHLGALERQGQISGWSNCDIQAGKEWASEVNAYLNAADIILLLVSDDFLASEYCYSIEMKRAIERHIAGEARVVPVLLRPVDWEGTPISKLQPLPKGGQPITLWKNPDLAFFNVARSIREIVKSLLSQQSKVDTESFGTQYSHQATGTDKQDTMIPYATIDTKEVISLFHSLMQQSGGMRIFGLEGKGKMGKSHLLTKVFPLLAQQDYQAQCIEIDLRNKIHTVPHILKLACSQLDSQVYNNYSTAYDSWRQGHTEDTEYRDLHLTDHFIKDVGKLNNKYLLFLFDSVDSATKRMQTWLMDVFLAQISSLRHVRVVIAGHSLPKVHKSYITYYHTHHLKAIEDQGSYIEYCQHLGITLGEETICAFAEAFDYTPGLFADIMLAKFV